MKAYLLSVTILGTVLFSTACPDKDRKIDLSTKATRDAAVEQMRNDLFLAETYEYFCWSNNLKPKANYDILAGSGLSIGTGQNAGRVEIASSGRKLPECDGLGNISIDQAQANAKRVRNDVFERGRGIVDEVYHKYANGIRRNRTITDFVFDLVDIGTGTAIGLTKGKARTLQVMGIALTGFRSGRSSFNLRIYDDQTTEIVLDQMDASRNEVYLRFRDVDSSRSVTQYPLNAVFADIYKYFSVGSQVEAFNRIRRKTAKNAENTEQAVLRYDRIEPSMFFDLPADVRGMPSSTEARLEEFDDAITANTSRDTDAQNVKDEKDTRLNEVDVKLRTIFTELRDSSFKANLQPFWEKVVAKSADLNTYYQNFLSNEVATKVSPADKLKLLDQLQQEITRDLDGDNDKKLAAAIALRELNRVLEKNKVQN